MHAVNGADTEADISKEQEQQLRIVMTQRDPMLVRILLGAALGALPKSRVDDIAAVLYDMLYVSAAFEQLLSRLRVDAFAAVVFCKAHS